MFIVIGDEGCEFLKIFVEICKYLKFVKEKF